MRRIGSWLAVAGSLLAGSVASGTASAQTPAGWSVQVMPYLWTAGLTGKVASSSHLPTLDVDASFGDVIKNFDFGMMMAAEFRYERFALIVDVMYLNLGAERNRGGPLIDSAKVDIRSWTVTAAASYRIYDDPQTITVDGFAGGRFWSQRQTLAVDPLGSARVSKSWIDAIVGATVRVPIGQGFSLRGTFDIGAGGSDLTWEALATIQYRSGNFVFEAGYRHLYDDYRSGGFLYRTHQSGPIFGAGYRF